MENNYYIFEGADGVGKTLLSKKFAELHPKNKENMTPLWICEPSTLSNFARELRTFCLDDKYKDHLTDDAREYLLMANRSIHMESLIEIIKTRDVISDRSFISGMVYAHVASGWSFYDWWEVGRKILYKKESENYSFNGDPWKVRPDIVIHVTAKKQKIDKRQGDIYDNANDDFHEKIKKTFPLAVDFCRELLEEYDQTATMIINFENDFTKSVEENVILLMKQILKE